ncbi:fasciclin domain-containing protein [Hymenobacter lapidiphilus]|uniref:fasciclin domain-containing protein n=1 Tax=Hymenobacter sp. CCM 8763 TaxID=2303334 RepID=UPI000E348924|nr:fasciclin domain-containing protein [Hymenobacter sp. CCM 8763]RFP63715.1 fasciclin domain-containing protein [Hymenobacter sp. CCM 8763]
MTPSKFPFRTLATVFVASSLAFGSASCSNTADTAATDTTDMATTDAGATTTAPAMTEGAEMGMDDTSSKNLAENAMAVPQMSTLATALKASGLADKATSGGPFTVFAPTNEAFDALPAGALDNLLKPENKAKLAGILTYHVVPGSVMAADLKDGQEVTTVDGKKLKVSISGGTVMINGATVVKADVKSSNGVTHVINQVLMPQ